MTRPLPVAVGSVLLALSFLGVSSLAGTGPARDQASEACEEASPRGAVRDACAVISTPVSLAAATEWVSPEWRQGANSLTRIHVLNMGFSEAQVQLLFYTPQGDVVCTVDHTVEFHHRAIAGPCGESGGWVRLVSDQPVVPSGWIYVQADPAHEDVYHMDWYRLE